jgi:DNA-binding NtrC family response regulator
MLRVLVVDDDKLIRWSLQEIFLQAGHKVETASHPQDALAKAGSSQYDLIFTDFEIEKSSAVPMLKTLHQLQPAAKLVVLSGSSVNQIESELAGLPVFRIIAKPFETKDIRGLVKEAQHSHK